MVSRAYSPIADYALLGDGATAALISRQGSIDWLPWPHFDSPSLFGALLDHRRGGRFSIRVPGPGATRRRYLPGTNVLETVLDGPDVTVTVTDFLAVARPRGHGGEAERRGLVRLVRGSSGRQELVLSCTPRPGYGALTPRLERLSAKAVAIHLGGQSGLSGDAAPSLKLLASAPLAIEGEAIRAHLRVSPGQGACVALVEGDPGDWSAETGGALLEETVAFWRGWLGRLRYHGPYREQVERSALALKALIFAPTGAIVAAPTTSLPEHPGGVRNWDYRFSWLRDATLTLSALHAIGFVEEARRYFEWLFRVARLRNPAEVRILYGLRGEHQVQERVLAHLEGYRGSRPVRIGNAACDQLQLDVYGELVDAFYTFREIFEGRAEDLGACYAAIDWVADNWQQPDEGIWEIRAPRRHFVYSKAMCWLALRRGVQLAASSSAAARWRRARDRVRAEVLERGFDRELGAFVQAYGHRILDASVLRLPVMGIVAASDPRMVSTVERIQRELTSFGLVYRYRDADDGLPGDEATFGACTFWLVEALIMMGRRQEAEDLFRTMLAYGSDLGLFAEEIDPATSAQWGNFPQAFTHLGLLEAAVRLERGHLRPRLVETASEPLEPGVWGIW